MGVFEGGRHGWVTSFSCGIYYRIYVSAKKFDNYPAAAYGRAMPDPKKQEYYQKNRETRIRYQNEYYRKNRSAIQRRREVSNFLDPEQKEALSRYNKEYYARNRDRIRARRKARATRSEGPEKSI